MLDIKMLQHTYNRDKLFSTQGLNYCQHTGNPKGFQKLRTPHFTPQNTGKKNIFSMKTMVEKPRYQVSKPMHLFSIGQGCQQQCSESLLVIRIYDGHLELPFTLRSK